MSQTETIPIPSQPKLGWGLAALVVAGNMIGSGVYLAPVALASTGSSSLIGWLICGAAAMVLAAVFAGLGRFQPDADGLTDFTRRGLGRFIGYQTAIAYWGVCLTGNVAVAIAGTGYLAFFFPALAQPGPAAICNLVLIGVTTAAYAAGARVAARLGAATLVIGLLPLLLAMVAGVVAFNGATFSASWSPEGLPLAQSVPASLVVIFWSFLGLESAAALSRLVRNPAQDVGRASVAGVGLALVVYVAASVAVFGVIPAGDLASSTSPFADLAARVFGASVAGLVAACAVIKALGTIAGWTILGGETARSAGEAGYLPRWFGTAATPGWLPISNPLINGAIMAGLILMTSQPTLAGQFGLLIGACTVLTICLYALCCISLFRFSRKAGWRVLAVVGLVFSVGAVVAAAPGNVVPAIVLFAVASVGWLFVRRSAGSNVDPTSASL
ncbi:amino acid permease [Brevundimonas sp.]